MYFPAPVFCRGHKSTGRRCQRMTAYEMVVVLKPQMEEEILAKAVTRIEEAVKNGNGEVVKTEHWGKRRLAYEMAGFTEGYYLLLQIKLPRTGIQELEHVLKISDEVIRHMIVKTDA